MVVATQLSLHCAIGAPKIVPHLGGEISFTTEKGVDTPFDRNIMKPTIVKNARSRVQIIRRLQCVKVIGPGTVVPRPMIAKK
jgi:hypothetical protein